MRERPILFSGPMVRAVLRDVDPKTQTRRLVKWRPFDLGLNLRFSGLQLGHYMTGVPESGYVLRSRGAGGSWNDRTHPEHCPYGVPGDRLWGRETWFDDFQRQPGEAHELNIDRFPDGRVEGIEYRASHDCASWEAGCPCNPDGDGKRSEWRPSIHMPRWASRITLEVTDVRVERLRSISEDDALAEGVAACDTPGHDDCFHGSRGHRCAFERLWDSINGKRCPWDANPFVWVIAFRKLET